MLYELRTYELVIGHQESLHQRFAEHTLRFFGKYGFRALGFWETEIGDSPELTYLLAWNDLNERQEKVALMWSDPEWLEIYRRTNAEEGPFVTRLHSKILRPTGYSALR